MLINTKRENNRQLWDDIISKCKHGDSFTCEKDGLKMEGKISIVSGVVYLCNNHSYAKGATATELLGYDHSWAVEKSITNLQIGEIVVNNYPLY